MSKMDKYLRQNGDNTRQQGSLEFHQDAQP